MASPETFQAKLKKAPRVLSEQEEALHRTRDYLEKSIPCDWNDSVIFPLDIKNVFIYRLARHRDQIG